MTRLWAGTRIRASTQAEVSLSSGLVITDTLWDKEREDAPRHKMIIFADWRR